MNIKKSIEEIKNDIYKYSTNPDNVKMLPVTKYIDSDLIKALYKLGCREFGENRVQSLEEKREVIEQDDIKWHFIGNLQRNKVKYIVKYIELIHSVDNYKLAKEINKRAKQSNVTKDILLEINVSGEKSKSGYSIEELMIQIDELMMFNNINIKGLMTMAPLTSDTNIIRDCFRKLRELKVKLNMEKFDNKLTELSMGMSNDYKIALEEDATIIRIGSKIFS